MKSSTKTKAVGASSVNSKKTAKNSPLTNLVIYVHDYINALNNSKLFAGLMIIILNIASRFVTVKLSKSMESYLKYTFSRQILIFAIAWMGTRDIYIAFIITLVFMIFMDFLFNEDSRFCCLPAEFTSYHHKLHDEHKNDPPPNNPNLPAGAKPAAKEITQSVDKDIITEEQIQQAKTILDKAKQQSGQHYPSFYTPIQT